MPVRCVRNDAGAEEEPPGIDERGPVSRAKVIAALSVHLQPRNHLVADF